MPTNELLYIIYKLGGEGKLAFFQVGGMRDV